MRQTKNTFMAIFLVLMLSIVLVACGGTQESSSDNEQTESGEAATENTTGGSLVIAVLSDATQLDPHTGADIPSANVYHGKIYETLVVQDEEMAFQPGLATDWERIDDYTWEFTLREGVTFHDGEPFNAEAVKQSIDRVLDEDLASVRAALFDMIVEIEIIDDHTIKFVTEYPFSPLLSNLAHYSGGIISPKAIEEDYAGTTPLGQNPVGTGAFKFASWTPGDEIVLERYNDYWGNAAKVDEVVFKVVPEATTRVNMIEAGQAHIAEPVPTNTIGRIEGSSNMELYRSMGLGIDYLGFNMNKAPYDNKLVRQAINLAVDTQAIIDHIYNGVGLYAEGPMGPAVVGYHPDLVGWGYDVEKAKELLAEAGFADGFETTIWTNDNDERMDVAEFVQASLSEIGINASVEIVEWGAYLEGTANGEHEMFILGWSNMTGDGDYNQYFLFHSDTLGSAGNRTFFVNEEVDNLIDEARRESDQEKRIQLYQQVQEIEVEEAPLIPLRHAEYIAAIGAGVEGFWLHPSRIMMLNDVTLP